MTVTVAPATALFGDVAYYIHDSAARLLDSGYFNSTRTLALNTSPSPLYLGDSYVVDAEGTSQRDFVGYLDDVRVYNTALSPWEARALAKLWSPAVAAPLAFQITNLVSDSAAGTATVTWNSKEDRTYELQWSETLEAGAWTTLPYTIYADAGATTTYIDYSGAAENGRRFYRVIEK